MNRPPAVLHSVICQTVVDSGPDLALIWTWTRKPPEAAAPGFGIHVLLTEYVCGVSMPSHRPKECEREKQDSVSVIEQNSVEAISLLLSNTCFSLEALRGVTSLV